MKKVNQRKRALSFLLVLTLLFGTMTLFSFASEEEVTVLYEEESKRTEYEKHYFCSDGSYIAVSYPQAVHYLDDDGVYRDIDNSLCYDEERAAYENAGNPAFGVSLSSENGLETVKVKGKDKEEITFSTALLVNGNGKTAQPKKKNINAFNRTAKSAQGKRVKGKDTFDLPLVSSSLEYAKYYGKEAQTVTGRYTLNGNSLKEDIVLSAPAGVTGFLTTYKAGGLTLTKNEDGSLTFSDEKGTALYTVGAPYMYDTDGSACPAISVTMQKKGNKYEVTYLPDASWLNSSERVYPLTFDPTFTATSSSFQDASYDNYSGVYSYNGTGTILSVSKQQLSSAHRQFAHVRILSYPSIDLLVYEITDASLVFKVANSSGSVPKMYRLADEYAYNEYPYAGFPSDYQPGESGYASTGTISGGYCTFDLVTEEGAYGFFEETVNLFELELLGKKVTGYVICETADYGTLGLYSSETSTTANKPQLTVTYTLRMPKGTSFTMQNEDAGTYLNMTSTGVTMTTARPAYSSSVEIVEHTSGFYSFYGIRIAGSNNYLNYSDTTNAVTVTEVAQGSEPGISSLWTMSVTEDGYSFSTATGTAKSLCVKNGTLQIASSSTLAQRNWIFKDHLSLDAAPEDNVEFVFYNKVLELCLRYPKDYSATAEITLAMFDPVIHTTKLVSGSYTAKENEHIQRFTFKAVRDAEGEILYYLILPYLKLSGDVEGSYKENYHLTLKTSGEIGICNTCAVGNPADECRWTLSGAITGMTVTNCGESVNLGVDLDEEIVAGVTAYNTDVWHVMPICLNVETDYQRTRVTCGAACGTMIVNYFASEQRTEEQFMQRLSRVGYSTSEHVKGLSKALNWEIDNTKESYNSVTQLYTNNHYTDNVPAVSSDDWRAFLSISIIEGYPVITNMISDTTNTEEIWGYASSSGHYVVITGIYWNSKLNCYEYVVNDPHYKFSSVGGRNLVIEEQAMYQVYLEKNHTMVFPSTLYDMVVSD